MSKSNKGTANRAANAPSEALMFAGSGRADADADEEAEDKIFVASVVESARVRDRAVAATVTASTTGDGGNVELPIALIHTEGSQGGDAGLSESSST